MLSSTTMVTIKTSGAGGYGPPSKRDPEAITHDRASGKFSDDYLTAIYPEQI